MNQRPESLFGLATGLSRDEAALVADALKQAWVDIFGRLPANLNADIRMLETYFNPITTGARLRREIAKLPELTTNVTALQDLLFFRIDDRHGLVTPEGRIALEILLDVSDVGDVVVIDLPRIAWANRLVADVYRTWTRLRLEKTTATKGSLQLPVVGFALTLLVNGSLGSSRALPIPRSDAQEHQLSRVIGPIVYAFVDKLRPDRKHGEPFRLRGGWIVTETTRHLFGFVVRDADRLWIREDAEDQLPRELSTALVRRGYSRPVCRTAVDALLGAYQTFRAELVSFGLSYETPTRTNRIRDALLDAIPLTMSGR